MTLESLTLWAALLAHVFAGAVAIVSLILRRRADRWFIALLTVAIGLHTVSLAARWQRDAAAQDASGSAACSGSTMTNSLPRPG